MSFFLFLDESGHDHRESPYEVLAGICVKDSDLWNFVKLIHDFEFECFDCKYNNAGNREIKARKFLNHKTFRLPGQLPPIPEEERTKLAKEAIIDGMNITKRKLTALAQAKFDYAFKVLKLCNAFRCRVFASIIADPSTIPKNKSMLRKDYVYLFERFYYFLEDRDKEHFGIIVFDELEKSASNILINQMDKYFKRTFKGSIRSNLIIPEPFFVHSDLSTGIQIADFICYILSWNLRSSKLTKPGRPELNRFLQLIKPLQYRTVREIDEKEIKQWSIRIV